jgi:hypothetical protein
MKQDSWCPASAPGAQQMSSYTSLSHTIYIIKIMVSIYISETFRPTSFHLLTHLFGYENDQCWELITFVAAQKRNSVPKTIPLFYELSCKRSNLHQIEINGSKNGKDMGIVWSSWNQHYRLENALGIMGATNGMLYDGSSEVICWKHLVTKICRVVLMI